MRELENWKVIEGQQLHNEAWLSVRRECVELPNGKRIPNYYTFQYPDWINIIAITKGGEYILVRQYRHGIKEVNWELCAGVCDPTDSNPMEAAKRELMEETGYGGGKWQLYMQSSANPGTHSNLVHSFIATDVEKIGDAQPEATEDLDVQLVSLDKLKLLLKEGKFRQAVMIAPLWKHMAEKS